MEEKNCINCAASKCSSHRDPCKTCDENDSGWTEELTEEEEEENIVIINEREDE